MLKAASSSGSASGQAAESSSNARRIRPAPNPRSHTDNRSEADRACMGLPRGWRQIGFGWLRHTEVALPAFVFEFDVLYGHRVGVCVQVGQRLVLGNPAAIDLVGEGHLSGLVVHFDQNILAERLQRNFRTESGIQLPDLVGPVLEFEIVRDSALERDGVEFRAAGGLAAARRIASLTVFHDFRGALEHADLAHARHVFSVPFHAEFEILVGIKTLRIDGEFSHNILLYVAICWVICWICIMTNSAGFKGAKPTIMFTIPRLMSFCVVVSLSHFTK